jgi:hypothetical protein
VNRDELGYLTLRPEDDGMPVVAHAADGTVVAYCATRKLAAAVIAALDEYYPGEFRSKVEHG